MYRLAHYRSNLLTAFIASSIASRSVHPLSNLCLDNVPVHSRTRLMPSGLRNEIDAFRNSVSIHPAKPGKETLKLSSRASSRSEPFYLNECADDKAQAGRELHSNQVSTEPVQ